MAPDGRCIVFTHKRVGEKNRYDTNLWLASTDSQQPPRPFTAGNRDSSPRFSPDGQTVAFISNREENQPQIYTIARSGGEAVKLTNIPEGTIGRFCWSPDGRMLAVAFREHDPQWTEQALIRARLDG